MTASKNDAINIREIISAIIEKLNLGNTAIFCGAGISFNSGLPLANDLIKYILTLLQVNINDAEKILQSNLPFESFIQTLTEEQDIEDILDIFSKGIPNTNHDLIAQLLKLGHVKTVLTTNFDMLIENALNEIGLVEGNDYQVFSNDVEFGNINWKTDTIRLIKIHGSIANQKEMAITLELVARKTVSQHKNNVITSFFSGLINPNILVLGYSCSDVFDISPLVESIEENRSQILFLEHFIEEVKSEDISAKEFKNPFKSYTGQRFFLNINLFTELLWKSIIPQDYEFRKSEYFWKENVNKWFHEASSYSLGMKNQIAARLFFDIGEYDLTIKLWEMGLQIAQQENNQIFFYAQLGSIGMTLNAIGKYKEAKSCLEESVKACREIGNTQAEISQLQALGNVYRNLREFDEAITAFNKALGLASLHEPESLCSCIGNLVNVYNQIGDYDNVIKILERGLPIALSRGNKQTEGSMLCSLGVALFLKGDIDKAFESVLHSLKLTQQISDRQGECIALQNLTNFFLQLEDYDNCLKYSSLGLQIAREIGIRQSEAAALYNLGTTYFFKGDQNSAIFHLKKAIEIYTEIFGNNHSHTISAINALVRAEKYPDSNKKTKMRMK
ncbi:tetratricopeptide repeat protein [Pedobacter frigiditerrae]|uniref:Tetratricopeptide repeat protein n=1 Tax=Pedobacter frigiditerrae TaxID=2530452 RepID=A0A4R0MQD5_9SPHI|nr:tetratricopeptide repeat protein [Pedobacter frigiditerrae]TCC88777.1 tetratricopeptide repeat protein [Pedobacter frigiditerrae]